jgi:membrane associated rhomboid family serine protease
MEQPWTIITSLFVHGHWMHLLFNMLALFFLGSYVLRLVGEARFLIIYFLGGLLGNVLLLALAYFFPLRFSFGVAVGASGAIFALGGTLAIMRPKLKILIFPIPIPMDMWIAVIILMAVSFFPYNVAWQAHLGGLILGLIAGFFFRRRERGTFWR